MLFSHAYKLPEIISTRPSSSSPQEQMRWRNVISEELFLYTLAQSPPVFIEPEAGKSMEHQSVSITSSTSLILSLTTLTCYRTPVALWLCNALAHHYGLNASIIMGIRIAAHEAIANAVIHGNLGMQEHFHGVQAFKAYHNRILALLDKPDYAMRRVTLSIFHSHKGIALRVSDEGNGYSEPYPRISAHELPLGKGLSLINRYSSCVTLLEGGRTIEMDFSIP